MAKISIQDMAKAIAAKHGLSQQEAETFVVTLFDVINEGLHREKIVKVKGLGTFKVIDVRERESVNVNTGERVVIESHSKITFTPDPIMRDLVNKPFAQFETVILNDGVDLDEMSKVQAPDDSTDDVEVMDEYDGKDGQSDADVPLSDLHDDNVEQELRDGMEDDASEAESQEIVDSDEPDDVVQNAGPIEERDIADIGDGQHDEKVVERQSLVSADDSDEDTADDNSYSDTSVIEQQNDTEPEDEILHNDEPEVQPETADEGFIASHKGLCFTILGVIIAAGAFSGGYFLGRSTVQPKVEYRTVRIVNKPVEPKVDADTVAKADTMTVVKAVEQARDTLKKPAVQERERHEMPVAQVDGEQSFELKNARAMVNTGAYRIVGTEKTITVKQGENLKKISRFYLGDGMECYIQVHNGIGEVKEGIKLKIPKLELKRKKK